MKDWQKHIADTHVDRKGFAICGEQINPFEFAFEDVDHAYQSIFNGGRLTPCPKCRAKVLEVFNTPE